MNIPYFEIKTDELILQLPKNLLWFKEKRVILTSTETKLLALFMVNENKVLGTAEITEWLYGEDLQKNRFALRVNIHYIREKLKKITKKDFLSRCKTKTYIFNKKSDSK